MRLSKFTDYAVVMMSACARQCGLARLNAADVAAETGIPLPTVQKLVSKLCAAGLLRSVRGLGGGFKLARPATSISLADIIEAIEGPIALADCVELGKQSCALEGTCKVQPHWAVVNSAVRGALAGVALTHVAGGGL
jgi:FeS assembly SUF system regulator